MTEHLESTRVQKGRERLQNEVEHLFLVTGFQKLIEADDEQKFRTFYEKLMATEVAAEALGDIYFGCNPFKKRVTGPVFAAWGLHCNPTGEAGQFSRIGEHYLLPATGAL